MATSRYGATFIGLLRDHGHGRSTIDANGQAVPCYALTDELDVRNTHRAIDAQARLHARRRRARDPAARRRRCRAGARATTSTRSSRGCSASRCAPAASGCSAPTRWAPAGWAPTRRRASPTRAGELHDTPGVWIGDASAFPTASGTNPMITIMALAHRTAEAIAAIAGATAQAAAASDLERRREHGHQP